MRLHDSKSGFTLVELLVVIAMLAVLGGAVGSGVASAQKNAKIAKATVETREITNAILAYENANEKYELPTINRQDASMSSLGFLLGQGGTAADGKKVPVLYNANLRNDKRVYDPWGIPYKVLIKRGSVKISSDRLEALSSVKPTTYMPNFYRLNADEEEITR